MSGRISVPCWYATPVANPPWKPLIIGEGQARYKGREIGGKSDWLGRLVQCRCLDRHVKEPHEMSMALGARP